MPKQPSRNQAPRRFVNRRPPSEAGSTSTSSTSRIRGKYGNAQLNGRSPYLTVTKRLEALKQEKEEILQQLEENGRLEKQLVAESEEARRRREEESMAKVRHEMKVLQERLAEKERQEKWIADKNRQEKESRERESLEKVQSAREDLMRKLNSHEVRLSEIRDQEEIDRLKQEKESMARRWKELEEEEATKHKKAEIERKGSILRQKEQKEIEKMELERLQRETSELKSLIQSKNNEESWLHRRLGSTSESTTGSVTGSTRSSVLGDDDAGFADDETPNKPHRRITTRRNRTPKIIQSGPDRQVFQNTDRSLETRFMQLTQEIGAYTNPNNHPLDAIPSQDKQSYNMDYNRVFHQLQTDLLAKKDRPISTEESERLEFMYKTVSMLKDMNQTGAKEGRAGGGCGCPTSNANLTRLQGGHDMSVFSNDDTIRYTGSLAGGSVGGGSVGGGSVGEASLAGGSVGGASRRSGGVDMTSILEKTPSMVGSESRSVGNIKTPHSLPTAEYLPSLHGQDTDNEADFKEAQSTIATINQLVNNDQPNGDRVE